MTVFFNRARFKICFIIRRYCDIIWLWLCD